MLRRAVVPGSRPQRPPASSLAGVSAFSAGFFARLGRSRIRSPGNFRELDGTRCAADCKRRSTVGYLGWVVERVPRNHRRFLGARSSAGLNPRISA
jgi:hypothetical protein